jgi:hypothetical protein
MFRQLKEKLMLLALLVLLAACAQGSNDNNTTGNPLASTPTATVKATPTATPSPVPTKSSVVKGPLPGQEIWKDGVSSYLFGGNDNIEYAQKNFQTMPNIQAAVKASGMGLIRSFFPDTSTDAEIEQRIKAIENSGAQCLAVLVNINNLDFNKHLVSYLGKRCLMYEFGNEPNYLQIPVNTYMAQWNKTIPILRQLNPSAKFVGPVTTWLGDFEFFKAYLNAIKQSGVMPDAISFHHYPCWKLSKDACLNNVGSYNTLIKEARGYVQNALGKQLPLGITEWNYDPGSHKLDYANDKDFITRYTTQTIQIMIDNKIDFACVFDIASYSGFGQLDIFNNETGEPKVQFTVLQDIIKKYRPA